jgi:hypothetical protein
VDKEMLVKEANVVEKKKPRNQLLFLLRKVFANFLLLAIF